MARLGYRFTIAALLVLFGAALSASPAAAQVPNIKFKGKVLETWALGTFRVNPSVEAVPYTVPVGQELVVTDVIISNPSAGTATAIISAVGGITLLSVSIQAESTFSHSYGSGIVFSGGESIRLLQTSGPSAIDYHLHGFLRKAK